MFKSIFDTVWAFDLEWVPDPVSGRLVYGLPDEMPDADVISAMWAHGGGTPDEPRPYLKTVLCRIVSLAVVARKRHADGTVSLKLHSLPEDADNSADSASEGAMLARFLDGVSRQKPQLVGFNSSSSDMPVIFQRALVNGLSAPSFCRAASRDNKEFMGYMSKYSDAHVDLKGILSGWGKSVPSLHEIAQVCGIPGKMGTDGRDVVELWLSGDTRRVVEYNEFDALTTYLLWLKTARLAGFFTEEEYACEEERVRGMITAAAMQPRHAHLGAWLEAWERLSARRKR